MNFYLTKKALKQELQIMQNFITQNINCQLGLRPSFWIQWGVDSEVTWLIMQVHRFSGGCMFLQLSKSRSRTDSFTTMFNFTQCLALMVKEPVALLLKCSWCELAPRGGQNKILLEL